MKKVLIFIAYILVAFAIGVAVTFGYSVLFDLSRDAIAVLSVFFGTGFGCLAVLLFVLLHLD